jgi:cytochrome c peroxidase
MTTTTTLAVGDRMEDGTIYAGVSPDTGRNIFVTPKDAPSILKWKTAMTYAAGLDANGHKDWKLPTRAELNLLYQNRHKGALRGTFNENGAGIAGWYWSSTERPDDADYASMVRLSDGSRDWDWKINEASVRPVRSEPRP